MPIESSRARDEEGADEKKVLRKLLVDEGETIRSLSTQVERVKEVFAIENPTGRIIFRRFGELGSDTRRVAALLLGKYFAQRLELVQDNSLGVSEIAHELGRPVTAMSGPLKGLLSE